MILVIGGLNGFVGSNTTEALVNLGKDCVVTRHKDTEVPGFLQKHIDNRRVIVEQADATSIDDLRRIGEKNKIDGIVNVAGGFKTPTLLCPGSKDTSTCSTRPSKSLRNGRSSGSRFRARVACIWDFQALLTSHIRSISKAQFPESREFSNARRLLN